MRSRILGGLTPRKGDAEYVIAKPIAVPLFKRDCAFECFAEDAAGAMDKIDAAVERFLRLDAPTLASIRPHLRDYHDDIISELVELGSDDIPRVPAGEDIIGRIAIGDTINVVVDEDGTVYLSAEGDCAWDEEHGVQLVFRNGDELCKVGPYDGHVTNVDAFDREDFAKVIYVKASML